MNCPFCFFTFSDSHFRKQNTRCFVIWTYLILNFLNKYNFFLHLSMLTWYIPCCRVYLFFLLNLKVGHTQYFIKHFGIINAYSMWYFINPWGGIPCHQCLSSQSVFRVREGIMQCTMYLWLTLGFQVVLEKKVCYAFIGVICFSAWRPHSEFLFFLAANCNARQLLKKGNPNPWQNRIFLIFSN